MYNNKRTLAIIPARGGSKGLPGKNIKVLCGKPLINWTIEQARSSNFIDNIFVSTDSQEIANVAIQAGIDVPFLRPEYLAKDTSSSIDVVEHVISYYKGLNLHFDYILLLEPTSPLRKEDDIDNVIKLAITNKKADGVISLGEVHMEHPMIVKKISENGRILSYVDDVKKITQRQQADKAFFPYGVSYLIKTDVLLSEKSFYTNNIIPYYIERWQNFEVDDIYDFVSIEAILTFKNKELL